MIVSDDTIYASSEEIKALNDACVTFAEAAGIALEASSEEIKALNDACVTFAEAAGIALESAIGAIMHIAEIEGGNISDAFPDEMETKPLPKRFRCRVCGRHYDFKGEAKACERNHKQWRC